MNPGSKAPLADASQLQRLRRLREDAARRELAACRERHDAAAAAAARRRSQVASLKRERERLSRWLGGDGAAALPRTAPYANSRRAALDEALERALLDLDDDEAALRSAERALEAARQRWAQSQARRRGADEHLATLARAAAVAAERRAERDAPEPPARAAEEFA